MLLLASENSKLYKLPIGRATFALKDVYSRARALGLDDIAEPVKVALGDARWAMQLVMQFRSGHSGLYPPAATKMDGVVDHTVAGLGGYLEAQRRLFRGEARGDAAERLLRILFPDGVAAIVRLPYTAEHAQIEAMLQRAAADDLADDIARLPELAELLERLAERNREYGAILSTAAEAPTRDDLRKAKAVCQERVAQVAFMLISHYGLREPDKADERDHLLEPILKQNEAMRLARRRQRPIGDIDPETGEALDGGPVNEDGAPDSAVADADPDNLDGDAVQDDESAA